MKCVFITSPSQFVVQYHSPQVVRQNAALWQRIISDGLYDFRLCEVVPTEFRRGCTAVFISTGMKGKPAIRLIDSFIAANPGILKAPGKHDLAGVDAAGQCV